MKRNFARRWIGVNLTLCAVLAVTWIWLRSAGRPTPESVAPKSPTVRAAEKPSSVNPPIVAPAAESTPPTEPQLTPLPRPARESDFLRYASQPRRKARLDGIEAMIDEMKRSRASQPAPELLPPPPTRRMGFMNFPELEKDPEFGAAYVKLKKQLEAQTDQAALRDRAMGVTSNDSVQRLGTELNTLGMELSVLTKDSPQYAEMQAKYDQARAKLQNVLFVLPLVSRLSYAPEPLTSEQQKNLLALAERESPTLDVKIVNRDGKTRDGTIPRRVMSVSDDFLASAAAVLHTDQISGMRDLKSEQDAVGLRRQLPAESEMPGPPGT